MSIFLYFSYRFSFQYTLGRCTLLMSNKISIQTSSVSYGFSHRDFFHKYFLKFSLTWDKLMSEAISFSTCNYVFPNNWMLWFCMDDFILQRLLFISAKGAPLNYDPKLITWIFITLNCFLNSLNSWVPLFSGFMSSCFNQTSFRARESVWCN